MTQCRVRELCKAIFIKTQELTILILKYEDVKFIDRRDTSRGTIAQRSRSAVRTHRNLFAKHSSRRRNDASDDINCFDLFEPH